MIERGPLTSEELRRIDEISDLADQIYTLATDLDKHPRHTISNAARLIKWVAYDYATPGDKDSTGAMASLRHALGKSGTTDD